MTTFSLKKRVKHKLYSSAPTQCYLTNLWQFTVEMDALSGPTVRIENDESGIAVNKSASLHFCPSFLPSSSFLSPLYRASANHGLARLCPAILKGIVQPEKRLFWDRVVQNFVEICGLAICGLAHLRDLRICNGGMSPWIFGIAICGLKKKSLHFPPEFLVASSQSNRRPFFDSKFWNRFLQFKKLFKITWTY